MKSKLLLASLCASLLAAAPLFAFRYDDAAWPNGNVTMVLSLGDNKKPSDGFTFNQSAADALRTWNQHMVRMQFVPAVNNNDVRGQTDGKNSAFFASSYYGEKFGALTLAVTLRSYVGSGNSAQIVEADVIFNSNKQFDSYRGSLKSGIYDFHRVALHEFGHVLGLDHPDDAGQNVYAVMNAYISNLDTLAKDDITGAGWIYGNPTPGPTPAPGDSNNLINLSTRGQVGAGDQSLIGGFIVQGSQYMQVMLRAIGPSLAASNITNFVPDPKMELHNANGDLIASNDDWTGNGNAQEIIDTGLAPQTQYDSVILTLLQPGTYTAVITPVADEKGNVNPGVGLFELYDFQVNTSRAADISTRGTVLGGDGAMIGGLIVGGSASKRVIARGIGPSLGNAGVTGALQDPTLEFRNSSGTLVAANDNWGDGADAATIRDYSLAPADTRESALLATVSPGRYTAIVRGKNGGTGVALVEVYDLSPAP